MPNKLNISNESKVIPFLIEASSINISEFEFSEKFCLLFFRLLSESRSKSNILLSFIIINYIKAFIYINIFIKYNLLENLLL